MPTLYVENVPREVYEALRSRARRRRRSIAAEVLWLLQENVPTDAELKARQIFMRKLKALHRTGRARRQVHPAAEEILRGDRER